jgi:hypothetical protein|tara:strand:- start:1092 stop:1553 length:462 start_codon:yes stop_codon:yes gene_type:complete
MQVVEKVRAAALASEEQNFVSILLGGDTGVGGERRDTGRKDEVSDSASVERKKNQKFWTLFLELSESENLEPKTARPREPDCLRANNRGESDTWREKKVRRPVEGRGSWWATYPDRGAPVQVPRGKLAGVVDFCEGRGLGGFVRNRGRQEEAH